MQPTAVAKIRVGPGVPVLPVRFPRCWDPNDLVGLDRFLSRAQPLCSREPPVGALVEGVAKDAECIEPLALDRCSAGGALQPKVRDHREPSGTILFPVLANPFDSGGPLNVE